MSKRIQADERLDQLYMKSLRCPYCHTKIPKGTSQCPNCGITKSQIYNADLVTHQRQRREKPHVLYSKVRPANIPFWKMGLGGMFGFLGVHCFIAKRYWRGAIILGCTLLFFIFGMIFMPQYTNQFGEVVPAHWLRALFERNTYIFPPDILGLVAIVMWVWDWVCILLGKFKYPVVLHTEEQ